MRRLYRPQEWGSTSRLHHSNEFSRGGRDPDHRRYRCEWIASRAKDVDEVERSTMRVLPVGTDYAGDRFVEGQAQAYRPGYRRRYGCEYLPLWNVSTHSRRNQSCLGGKRMS